MMQMYFLSIILNVLAGLILLSKKEPEAVTNENAGKKKNLFEDMNKTLNANDFFKNKTVALVTGILAVLVGVIKFFCVAKGGIIILGDLFPAAMGITAGFALLLNYYISTATTQTNLPAFFKLVFIDNIYWVGFASCAVAVLHFIMPGVLFF